MELDVDNRPVYFNKQTGEASVHLPEDFMQTTGDMPDLFEQAVLDIMKTYIAKRNKRKMSTNDFKEV